MLDEKRFKSLASLMAITTVALLLGWWLTTAAADSLWRPSAQSPLPKQTPVGGFPTPDPNATPVVFRIEAHVLASPLSPLPRPTLPPDTTPPTSTHHFSGTAGLEGWYRSPVTVSFQAWDDYDGVLVYYRLPDDAPWIQGLEWRPLPVVTEEGEWSLSYYASDRCLNREWPPNTGTVRIDLTTPTTTHQLEGSLGLKGWYTSPVTITLSAEDKLSGLDSSTWRLNGSGWMTYTAPFAVTDGQHTLDYLSTDLAGNIEPTRTTSFNVDTSPPTTSVQIELVYIGLYPFRVTLTPEDAHSGPDYTVYRLTSLLDEVQAGGEWKIYTAPFYLPDGEYLLEVYSVDQAGNREAIIESTFGPASP